MKKIIREILDEVVYIFCNYIVCNIPIWVIRKFIYKVLGMHIGKGTRILMKVKVVYPWKISIGKYTIINEACFLDGRGGMEIGDNVTVAIYSKLITGYHHIDDENFSYQSEKIKIENNAVIFANCTILGGALIRHGCVIAAASLVQKGDYKENGLYAGVPAKYKRPRHSEAIYVQDSWMPIFR